MENEILKINILSIAVSGLLMMVVGVILYSFKEHLTYGSIRFFLPIPPIGVGAYIFAFNMFKHYQCSIPEKSTMISEILIATFASTIFFLVFTVIIILLVNFLKNI
ncbi:MAG: hypothetical protein GXP56_07945 [Deltaproteobacteria bacterium]|nr:hypothetical protein [Deltaproteobacteria bacterium]